MIIKRTERNRSYPTNVGVGLASTRAGPTRSQTVEHHIRCKFREEKVMAAGRCDICERKPMYGNNVPFSQHRTRRRFVLNVHRRRLEINGTTKTVNICTRCLRTLSKLPKVRK